MPRRPFRAAGQADRWQRKALIVTVDPVEIVVSRTWEADHLPRDHIAVAAVNRIGEETRLDVLEHRVEEALPVGALELDLSAFEAVQNFILVRVGELGECFGAVVCAAVAIERRKPGAVSLCPY